MIGTCAQGCKFVRFREVQTKTYATQLLIRGIWRPLFIEKIIQYAVSCFGGKKLSDGCRKV